MIDRKEPIRHKLEEILRTAGESSLSKELSIPILKILVTGEVEPDEDAYRTILSQFRDGFMDNRQLAMKIGYSRPITPEQITICKLLNVALQNEFKRIVARK